MREDSKSLYLRAIEKSCGNIIRKGERHREDPDPFPMQFMGKVNVVRDMSSLTRQQVVRCTGGIHLPAHTVRSIMDRAQDMTRIPTRPKRFTGSPFSFENRPVHIIQTGEETGDLVTKSGLRLPVESLPLHVPIPVKEPFAQVGLDYYYLSDYFPDLDTVPAWIYEWNPSTEMNVSMARVWIVMRKATLIMPDHEVDLKREGMHYAALFATQLPNARRSISYWARCGNPKITTFNLQRRLERAAKEYAEDNTTNPYQELERAIRQKRFSAKYSARWLYEFDVVAP